MAYNMFSFLRPMLKDSYTPQQQIKNLQASTFKAPKVPEPVDPKIPRINVPKFRGWVK